MNFKKIIILISTFFITSAYAKGGSGVDIGNGGYIIRCSKGVEKIYALDYLLVHYGRTKPPYATQDGLTLKESLERLDSLISTKLPELYESYNEYVSSIRKRNKDSPYSWIDSYDLEDIRSEGQISRVPFACFSMLNNDRGRIQIAILRRISETTGKINFYYNSDVLNEVGHKNPVQLSFLYLHEWLWNFVDNNEANRNITYYLHSDAFERFSSQEVRDYMKKQGFKFPE